jgi:hypothetical protein
LKPEKNVAPAAMIRIVAAITRLFTVYNIQYRLAFIEHPVKLFQTCQKLPTVDHLLGRLVDLLLLCTNREMVSETLLPSSWQGKITQWLAESRACQDYRSLW